jgi:hypothetical protein
MDAKILDKIRKLLALAKGNPNQGEMETALEIAQRLMLEHGIDESDVSGPGLDGPLGDDWIAVDCDWRSKRGWVRTARIAGSIVQGFFSANPMVGRALDGATFCRLFGHRADVPLACHVFVYVERTLRTMAEAYVAGGGASRDDYLTGVHHGLYCKLDNARRRAAWERSRTSLGRGLILRQRRDELLRAEVEKRFADLPTVPARRKPADQRVDSRGYIQGLMDGNGIDIAKPLAGSSAASQDRIEQQGGPPHGQ